MTSIVEGGARTCDVTHDTSPVATLKSTEPREPALEFEIVDHTRKLAKVQIDNNEVPKAL